jgi:hypothetical protein
MTPYHRVFLCAVVIIMMVTAGCTFPTTSGAPPLVTQQETAASLPGQYGTVPEATAQPGAAGTQAADTCTADISSDPANCGGCGYACPANAVCQQGQCYCAEGYAAENNQCVAVPAAPAGSDTGTGCPAGMSPCPDGYCYELTSSPDNCGICGNVCPAGMICSASTCTNIPTEATTSPTESTTTATVTVSPSTSVSFGPVPSGAVSSSYFCLIIGGTMCSGSCVNLTTSNGNCGSCGHICSGLTATCCNGVCTNLKTDSSNCGSCGHKCLYSTSCVAGSCKSLVYPSAIPGVTKIPTYAKIVNPVQIPIPGF